MNVVFDTNIMLSGLKSRNGLSFKLLELIPKERFKLCVSVPLILEYESILLSKSKEIGLTSTDIDSFLNYICKVGSQTKIHYLWRPVLKDPFDDHLLELAVVSNSKYIITYNRKDFDLTKKFGILAITPKDFLLDLGEIS